MRSEISVIIPLYNKEREVTRAIESVLAQTAKPLEIIVIDDGSTDCGAAIAAKFPVKILSQPNSGVSVARNRGITEAHGKYVALLDADDAWEPGYLAEIERLIAAYPDCGAYATAFRIDDDRRLTPASTPTAEGIVDFFRESLSKYVLIPSTTTLRRDLTLSLGGFPDGMRLGEDQYLWTKLARTAPVCFSPKPLVRYSRAASNRSVAIYTPEKTAFSFEDLYDPASTDLSNEYIARAALGKALAVSIKGGTSEARRAVQFFAYTRKNRATWYKIRLLNGLPPWVRTPLWNVYKWMAWKILKKGLA